MVSGKKIAVVAGVGLLFMVMSLVNYIVKVYTEERRFDGIKNMAIEVQRENLNRLNDIYAKMYKYNQSKNSHRDLAQLIEEWDPYSTYNFTYNNKTVSMPRISKYSDYRAVMNLIHRLDQKTKKDFTKTKHKNENEQVVGIGDYEDYRDERLFRESTKHNNRNASVSKNTSASVTVITSSTTESFVRVNTSFHPTTRADRLLPSKNASVAMDVELPPTTKVADETMSIYDVSRVQMDEIHTDTLLHSNSTSNIADDEVGSENEENDITTVRDEEDLKVNEIGTKDTQFSVSERTVIENEKKHTEVVIASEVENQTASLETDTSVAAVTGNRNEIKSPMNIDKENATGIFVATKIRKKTETVIPVANKVGNQTEVPTEKGLQTELTVATVAVDLNETDPAITTEKENGAGTPVVTESKNESEATPLTVVTGNLNGSKPAIIENENVTKTLVVTESKNETEATPLTVVNGNPNGSKPAIIENENVKKTPMVIESKHETEATTPLTVTGNLTGTEPGIIENEKGTKTTSIVNRNVTKIPVPSEFRNETETTIATVTGNQNGTEPAIVDNENVTKTSVNASKPISIENENALKTPVVTGNLNVLKLAMIENENTTGTLVATEIGNETDAAILGEMSYSSGHLPPRLDDSECENEQTTVASVVAPVKLAFNSCLDGIDCGEDAFAHCAQLVPRYALSVLSARIRGFKTRLTSAPACNSHVLIRSTMFPIEGMHVANSNAFAVKDGAAESCLFVFYGGPEVVDRFESLPQPTMHGEDTDESYRHDMFTTAIYLPYNGDGDTAFLPIATNCSRMLFVLNSGRKNETSAMETQTIDDVGSVFGSAQMWFRNEDDMRVEFKRLQQLLCVKTIVGDDAIVYVAFTVEMPATEMTARPTSMVEGVWKDALRVTGTNSRIPVEMFVDHSAGYFLNDDFDSITVHGYLMDAKSYAQLITGGVEVRTTKPTKAAVCGQTCGVRIQYIGR